MRFVIIILAVLISCNIQAQRKSNYNSAMTGKKYSDVFPDKLRAKPSGWYFSPGFTLMQPQIFSFVKNIITKTSESPYSRFGLYLEAGRYKLFEYYTLFRYMDYGIAYKSLRGGERKSGEKFGDHFISAHFNLNNTINIGKYSFIGNTVGVNADYAFITNSSGDTPGSFIGQLHYKFSYGYKASSKLMIIPAIETPILNLYPFYYGSSSLTYLSSRYHPFIFSIRFLFLRPVQDVCPPVYAPGMLEDYTPTDMGN